MPRLSLLLLAALCMAATVATAQKSGPPTTTGKGVGLKNTSKSTTTDSKILESLTTQTDASTTFVKLERLMHEVLTDLQAKSGSPLPKGNAPESRTVIVKEFHRLFLQSKPVFRYSPPMQKIQTGVFQMKDSQAKAMLVELAQWGFVAKLGPLGTNPKDNIAVGDFGDAVGYFIARLAELTHTPSSKFSPALNGNDGG